MNYESVLKGISRILDWSLIEKYEFKMEFTHGMMRSHKDSWVYILDTSVA